MIRKLKKSNLKKAFLCAAVLLFAKDGCFLQSETRDKSSEKKELKAPETQVLLFSVDTMMITKENCDSCLTVAQYQKTTDAITSF